MYCSRCGRELQEEMNFCPNCGMNINMQNKSENIELQRLGQDSERNVILRNLDKAIPIYLNVEKMQAQLERLQMEKKNAETFDGIKVICCGAAYVVIVLVEFILVMLYEFLNTKGKMTWYAIENITWHTREDITYIILLSPVAIVIIMYVLYSIHIIKKLKRKISLLDVQLKTYINENMCNEVFFLPEKYRYHFAACYICEYVANGRANNLSEAMNQYEEQLHRWKMENMQEQLLRVRQKTVFVVM